MVSEITDKERESVVFRCVYVKSRCKVASGDNPKSIFHGLSLSLVFQWQSLAKITTNAIPQIESISNAASIMLQAP
jgi:hypothetical protein